MPRVLVVGTGLIGTSVGLALQQSARYDVLLRDPLREHESAAARRGAGMAWNGSDAVDVALVAVPPRLTAGVLSALQQRDVASTYTHTASYQSHVQAEIEALGCDASQVVGGHPLAGRETSGPAGASADLFVGRPWAVCPSAHSTRAAVDDVTALAVAVGATPLELPPSQHDGAVALLSHLPQVAATALAALLTARPGVNVDLSGPGLADTTRLAASSPTLWTEILTGNAREVSPLVRELSALLTSLADDLDALSGGAPEQVLDATARVEALLQRGNQGRALVPVKRGQGDEGFHAVAVVVDDRPGRLAALLLAAADSGVNVEDVRVDHVPGRPTGVISLLVGNESVPALVAALRAGGWRLEDASA